MESWHNLYPYAKTCKKWLPRLHGVTNTIRYSLCETRDVTSVVAVKININ